MFHFDPGSATDPSLGLLGSGPLWRVRGPEDASRENEVKFFLPSVRNYLLAAPSYRLVETHEVARWYGGDLRFAGVKKPDVRAREDYRFTLANGLVHLFQGTGIGTDARVPPPRARLGGGESQDLTLRDLVRFNFAVSRLDRSQKLLIRREGPNERNLTQAAELPEYALLMNPTGLFLHDVAELLLQAAGLSDVRVEFLNERAFKVQTFAQLAEPEPLERFGEALYFLRRVANEGYMPLAADLDVERGPEIVRNYGHSVHGCALEGVATLETAWRHEFSNEFIDRARTSYFAHYLLALHQRAASLMLAAEAGRLPFVPEDADRRGAARFEEFRRGVNRLRIRTINFNLHHRFDTVSAITPYAQFYGLLRARLGLDDLANETREEATEVEQQLRAMADDLQARASRNLNVFLSVLGPFGALLALFGTNLGLYSDFQGAFYTSPWFLIPVGVWLISTLLLVRVADPGLPGRLFWAGRSRVGDGPATLPAAGREISATVPRAGERSARREAGG